MLNRTVAPPAKALRPVKLPAYQTATLTNGMQVYFLPFGDVDVIDVQVLFRAGKHVQPKIGVAGYTARNLQEGTKSFSSLELSKALDRNGAWLSYHLEEEGLAFSLATVTANLAESLPCLMSVLMEPAFPEDEFEKMRQRSLQKIQIDSQKTTYQARRHFGHLLFGPEHPYGGHFGAEEVKAVNLDDLKAYYDTYLHPGNAQILVIGKFEQETVLRLLEQHFGALSLKAAPDINLLDLPTAHNASGRHHIEQAGMQSTIRLGHRAIPRSHPDFYPLQVVNTILGGYYGSRLMKSIREDKGFTYGIYSGLIGQRKDGYLVVQSDLANEYVEAAITEVRRLMQELREKAPDQDEMEVVKNYLLGQSINRRETPFQMGDILRYSLTNGISFDEIDRRFEVIQELKSADVPVLASKYFQPEGLLEVVCGTALT
ncbi:MAG: pitrilysin family protein, partial [Bacteroidota bacterium]